MSLWDVFGEDEEDDLEASVASKDYPVLAEILIERPPLPHSTPVTASLSGGLGESVTPVEILRSQAVERDITAEAGFFGDMFDALIGDPPPTDGRAPSFDWCRFRRDQVCYFPTHLNQEATRIAGYEVWVVKDRGICHRYKWKDQENCPVSEPGPNSRHPHALIECTRNWEDGGQRDGTPGPFRGPRGPWPESNHLASLGPMAASLLPAMAAWKDVRDKARDIRRSGGVKVIAVTDRTITAEVQGHTAVYQTTLLREGKTIAMWECSCPWAAYSWDRSGRWKRFEGRMCSHALALVYETQSQEFGGGEVTEGPGWSAEGKPPTFYEAPPKPDNWQVSAARNSKFPFEIDPETGQVYLDGQVVTTYPSYHPTLGLTASKTATSYYEDEYEPCSAFEPSEGVDPPYDQYCKACHWHRDEHPEFKTGSRFEARTQHTAEIDPADPDEGMRMVEEACAKGDHTHSGLVIKAVDSGRVLLAQRTPYSEDPEGVYGRWEFPGGSIGEGETPFDSAVREFAEETGLTLPEGWRVDGCYESGSYIAIVVLVPNEGWTTNAELLDFETMGIGWFHPDQIEGTDLIREEMESADWEMVREATSGPYSMLGLAPATAAAPAQEVEAILHDEPEPALPTTEGADDEDDEVEQRRRMLEGSSGITDADIAKAARQRLAAAVFSPKEQMELIEEGDGEVEAANLDRLQIAGTHYEQIEQRLQSAEDLFF